MPRHSRYPRRAWSARHAAYRARDGLSCDTAACSGVGIYPDLLAALSGLPGAQALMTEFDRFADPGKDYVSRRLVTEDAERLVAAGDTAKT